MSRLAPYRSRIPALVESRIEQTLHTTMYLVQTSGPTSFVVQERNNDRKFKVYIGTLQSCSCGDAEICIHILFVMLKVLRVPREMPILWQKSLIDSEIDLVLGGNYKQKANPNYTSHEFLRKKKRIESTLSPDTENVARHELALGEVCAICQEEMLETEPLTFCRKGCGNNFHIECMRVFGESRKQSKESIICPLCRKDWGQHSLTDLRREENKANKKLNVHKNIVCKKCATKPIRVQLYRCLRCKNVNLCERCFKTNVHPKHFFVTKSNVTDSWEPAYRDCQPRKSNREAISRLQGREISTNDYELLLQLDSHEYEPLHHYLMSVLPGKQILAEDAKRLMATNEFCSICQQVLRSSTILRETICGHTFHEGCMSRLFLVKEYACPQPGCGVQLFPGLAVRPKFEKILEPVSSKNLIQDLSIYIGPSKNVWKALEAQAQRLDSLSNDLSDSNENGHLVFPSIRPISVESCGRNLRLMEIQTKKKSQVLPKMVRRKKEINTNPLSLMITGHNNISMSECKINTLEKPTFAKLIPKLKSVKHIEKHGKFQRLQNIPTIQSNSIQFLNPKSLSPQSRR
ncbi:unnamed protein product [Albugo candida]|uniref:RING-type domain-containing protein n=1 Tax=Albugo candida TaxID=65357 RepID=A0A024FUZ1_9STRA|nr:unnamed protein product [Albugo candida]|eukprot:CCI10940.1 unnamed protein product [Albugo candida]